MDAAREVRLLQLSLVQFADQYNLSANGLTSLLSLLGGALQRIGLLRQQEKFSRTMLLPTVPTNRWQNRADRLRAQLLDCEEFGGSFEGMRFYAMCPDPFCGKLHQLDDATRRLPASASLRCNRRLLSERTEWPLDEKYHGTPRPVWPQVRLTPEGELQPEPADSRSRWLSTPR